MNARLLETAVEYHGKELFNLILKQNNCQDSIIKSDEDVVGGMEETTHSGENSNR